MVPSLKYINFDAHAPHTCFLMSFACHTQLPADLPGVSSLRTLPDSCPACGFDLEDLLVDGLMKAKHSRHAVGNATLVAQDTFFVSDGLIALYEDERLPVRSLQSAVDG